MVLLLGDKKEGRESPSESITFDLDNLKPSELCTDRDETSAEFLKQSTNTSLVGDTSNKTNINYTKPPSNDEPNSLKTTSESKATKCEVVWKNFRTYNISIKFNFFIMCLILNIVRVNVEEEAGRRGGGQLPHFYACVRYLTLRITYQALQAYSEKSASLKHLKAMNINFSNQYSFNF